jgi:hypothetical protein
MTPYSGNGGSGMSAFPVWLCSHCGILYAFQFPPDGLRCHATTYNGTCRGELVAMRMVLEPLTVQPEGKL